MALENLEPATRIESILDGEDIAPATRLEYFLKQAAAGGGIKELIQAEPFYVTDMETSGTKLFSPGVDKCSLWGDGELINLDMFFVDTLEFPYIVSNVPNSYELPVASRDLVSDNPPDSSNYGFGVLPNKTYRVLFGTSGKPIGVAVEKESIAYYLCDFR